MGMAASQARLLTLTARTHDVEFEAQSIQNAKLQLSTQQDEVYNEYIKALDAVTLTFASTDINGTPSTLTATFTSLFSENAAQTATGNNYALISARNQVVVSEDIYNGYYEFVDDNGSPYTQNAYNFAMYMLYGGSGFESPTSGSHAEHFLNAMRDKINELITGEDPEDSQLQSMFADALGIDNIANGITISDLQGLIAPGIGATQNPAVQSVLNQFFSRYGMTLFNEAELSNEDVSKFNYYMRMFEVIKAHGGCISIDFYNECTSDNAADNSEWLTAMIQSGQLSIQQINVDNHGNVTTTGVGVDSDQNMKYSNNTEIDKTALAKAEANYEHAMKIIDRKDKKYDLELNRLETERAALTKEYDSVKKVIEDNIEKSFGIFS